MQDTSADYETTNGHRVQFSVHKCKCRTVRTLTVDFNDGLHGHDDCLRLCGEGLRGGAFVSAQVARWLDTSGRPARRRLSPKHGREHWEYCPLLNYNSCMISLYVYSFLVDLLIILILTHSDGYSCMNSL